MNKTYGGTQQKRPLEEGEKPAKMSEQEKEYDKASKRQKGFEVHPMAIYVGRSDRSCRDKYPSKRRYINCKESLQDPTNI